MSRGLTPEDLKILMNFVDELKPGSNYVELGVAEGSSMIAVSTLRPDVNCYGIEINQVAIGMAISTISDLKIKNIEIINGDSMEVCKNWNKEIDLLFIDGDHMFPQIFYDFIGWYPHVKSGSNILMHDFERREEGKYVGKHDVGMACDVFRGHKKFNTYIPSIDDMISSSMVAVTKE